MRDADPFAAENIGMELLEDVRVDPDAPMLSFCRAGISRSYWVDGQGINALRLVAGRHAPIVEVKLDGGEGDVHAVLLALRDRRGTGHWGAARMIRLDRFVSADQAAAFKSFLAQVSAVLADLQHDLRQPLAAISLAAHNGPGLLEAGKADAAIAKFARILEQVDHCEERLQRRIARFGSDAPDGEVLPFILAVHAAVAPVREWMADAHTDMIVSGSLPTGSIRVIPGAIETLIRYILKRSIEKSRARRTVKVVDIVLGEDPAALRVTIRYNAGVDTGDAAGDDVTLALARRMMAQIGGEIVMPSSIEREAGVAATLLFPRHEPAGEPDQLALASSLR
jgi:signal transduction histidine kinase